MPFRSILFDGSDAEPTAGSTTGGDVVVDLHLDEIVAAMTAGREAYDLGPIFLTRLRDVVTVAYRHDVFRDLERPEVRGAVTSFAARMRTMRGHATRAARVRYRHERARWHLAAAAAYVAAVVSLADDLARAEPRSTGLRGLEAHLAGVVGSPGFAALRADTDRVRAGLDAVTYRLQVSGPRVTVSACEDEPDYGAEVLDAFEKFRQGAPREQAFRFPVGGDLNHVEGAILERVARLHPGPFGDLDAHVAAHADVVDGTIARFDSEVQFYLGYLELVERLRDAGLPFCYPEVATRPPTTHADGAFDLALALTLVPEGGAVVPNSFRLEDPERIVVVTGPNQGGKTTFSRMVGQVHHLAAIGGLVPGTAAGVALVDGIFTHFEREEDAENLSGKLEDDLRRIHAILAEATARSLVVMNESFSSTTPTDALLLNRAVLGTVVERGMLCVTVTFLDELASLGPATVSMVGAVDPADPGRRTFRVERRPADGLAYALAIAEKHRLTRASVAERLAR